MSDVSTLNPAVPVHRAGHRSRNPHHPDPRTDGRSRRGGQSPWNGTTDPATFRQLMDELGALPTRQQPLWPDPDVLHSVHRELLERAPLVRPAEVDLLSSHLSRVAAGRVHVLQAGDCAEDPEQSSPTHVIRKAGLLDTLAGALRMSTGKPVVRVGRIAGQYVKPRSQTSENVQGTELPVFRGHMVNSPLPGLLHRLPDPRRILLCHDAAAGVMQALRSQLPHGAGVDSPVWTSHEALLLDYEVPALRRLDDGRLLLTSTHWPWIGERTRHPDGAHVELLSRVANPVACKVGPQMSAAELLTLCERLDPRRRPGRLTLIARIGADLAGSRLPDLVKVVREEGYPVIWMCDPMHGNTISSPRGRKTRLITSLIEEVRQFRRAVEENGGAAGGLHLEATPDAVTECVADAAHLAAVDAPDAAYLTACDPRLSMSQALSVISAWEN
ncbi:3-deoxy-7-phosphoheptulonate synthase [Kineosporia sp. NBRC 101731]|uniref:3-deoxy-7-phosphoheptulonate synthase n=1 Tax=Kineosporia sp. NBRC 101731 TaxID=3032199 RepID=UPI0024A10FCE|nr:3-deoxy-7-phosphoheptulonate synthase [Kineosporia sp. NBRC 101731]GLY32339.1 phospho-2-dehydro-3-deoxyheptonate aldolase [Kineosporia sp. NBRC 101731]